MSSFDFTATVASGSTLVSTAVGSVSLSQGAAGLLVLFGLQVALAVLRRRGALGGLIDNGPLLAMAGAQVLDDLLRRVRVSREELFGQLRTAGVRQLHQVHAVVLRPTGDLSILTADRPMDAKLLRGVHGADRLRAPHPAGSPRLCERSSGPVPTAPVRSCRPSPPR